MSVRENVAWGVKAGLFFGIGLCGLALIPGLLILVFVVLSYIGEHSGGSTFWVPGTTAASLQMLLVFPLYLLAGNMGGAVIGLLRPLMRWHLGATFVGMLAGVILCGAVSFSILRLMDIQAFSGAHLFSTVVPGVIVGGTVAFTEWKRF